MRNTNTHGLAIVNTEGILVGSLSVRDLRGIGQNGAVFSRLFKTVKEFKEDTVEMFPKLGPTGHYDVGRVPLTARYVPKIP